MLFNILLNILCVLGIIVVGFMILVALIVGVIAVLAIISKAIDIYKNGGR